VEIETRRCILRQAVLDSGTFSLETKRSAIESGLHILVSKNATFSLFFIWKFLETGEIFKSAVENFQPPPLIQEIIVINSSYRH